MKQTVAPLQANEVNILRRKLASYDVKQHEFRESFRKKAPFAYTSDYVYERIDRVSICSNTCHYYTGRLTERFMKWKKK